MTVLLLTQLFQPEPNHLKGLAFARAVRDRGIDLRVLTGFPNYPLGRTYDGYRQRPVRSETMEGVPVTRVPVYPSRDRSATRRALTYGSFGVTSAVMGVLQRFRADIVHTYLGPVSLAVPALAVRACRGSRVLLDVQDLWPESLAASGMASGGRLLDVVDRLSSQAYRASDRLIVLSQGYKDAIVARGAHPDRIDVVPNWCDERQVPARVEPAPPGGPVRILYAGNVGTPQALDVILGAAVLLRQRGVPAAFTIAGDGTELERLRSLQLQQALDTVRFIGRVPAEAMPGLYAGTDGVLVHLRDDSLAAVGIPQKTQTAMAAGRPVLAGVRGETSRLVESAHAGLIFEPESAEGLAAAVTALAALPADQREILGANGRRYYQEHMSFSAGVAAVVRVYEKMVGSSAAA